MDEEKYCYNDEIWDYDDLLGYLNFRDLIIFTVSYLSKRLGGN